MSSEFMKMFEKLQQQAYARGVADGREFQKAEDRQLKRAVERILSKSPETQESPWKSMDSAPKDGSRILVYGKRHPDDLHDSICCVTFEKDSDDYPWYVHEMMVKQKDRWDYETMHTPRLWMSMPPEVEQVAPLVPPEVPQWKSMDSAPKDGTNVVISSQTRLTQGGYKIQKALYEKEREAWIAVPKGGMIPYVRLWMSVSDFEKLSKEESLKSPQQNAEDAYSGYPPYQD